MLRHAASVVNHEELKAEKADTESPKSPQEPIPSSGLRPQCSTPRSKARTQTARKVLGKAVASNRFTLPHPSLDSAVKGGTGGARNACYDRSARPHRASNEVTTHIQSLRPARNSKTHAPALIGFEPTFASGIALSKSAVGLLLVSCTSCVVAATHV